MPPDLHLTTSQVWACTGILLVLDVFLGVLAGRLIHREHMQRMRWVLILCSGGFFLLVWTSAMVWAWEWFYRLIFPTWARTWLPPIFGVGYAILALGLAWLSMKVPGKPAVIWCVLGGVEGLLSHLYAIYGLGAASKPPIMQGTDPFSVLVFAIFEKAFYWTLILFASWVFWRRVKHDLV